MFFQYCCAGLTYAVRHSSLSVFTFVSLLLLNSTVAFALSADNTGKANFTISNATAISLSSNTIITPIVLPNEATLSLSLSPNPIQDGYSAVATATITNIGATILNNGVLTLTQPANTVLTLINDVNGAYTVQPVPGTTDWEITLTNPLAIGGVINIVADVAVPYGVTAADVTMNGNFRVVSMPDATASAILTIFNQRTIALIEFMHFDAATGVYSPADAYRAGSMIYVQVTDADQNHDPFTDANIGTVTVTLTDGVSGDTVTLTLTETGINTGVFIGNTPSIRSNLPNGTDGALSVSAESIISASYVDSFDNTDTAASAALVDPFGIVFDSVSGAPIDGVTVSIVHAATGVLATVFGDDGVSIYPSTLISGGSTTDAGGTAYNFASGQYRFPFMAPGDYRLVVTPPGTSYSFPSQATNTAMQNLAAGPFALVVGSRGETFTLAAGPALHIDLPLDAKGVNLFVQKTTSTPVAGVGDRIQYLITVENVHPSAGSSVTSITDILPLGLRYVPGSTTLNSVKFADPVVLSNGRNLTFSLGIIPSLTTVTLAYTAIVGANVPLGKISNIAFASGTMAGAAVLSNTAKAVTVIREELIRSRGFIVGTVFIDENLDDIQDDGEEGVAGVRIFMEDGRSVLTDKDGRYHMDGLRPGLHVVQMDRDTIADRYQAVGLKQTRFSKNDFSQFADVRGGGLHRANFRLIHREPDFTPVTVQHTLSKEEDVIWADVDFIQNGDVDLANYKGFYVLPAGWSYVDGSAMVDGVQLEPEQTLQGLVWQLDADQDKQRVRLALSGSGEAGMKQAVAYARFTSEGTENGRTGLASIDIEDTLTELSDQRAFTLNLKFATRKAFLPNKELLKLDEMVHSLRGLRIHELIVEGHTDHIQIAKKHRHEFRNNIVLSQARAAFVAAYLKEKLNLSDDVVFAVGKGALEPIASNVTSRGRHKNRRVVLKVRATKVEHDFATKLQGKYAESFGKAEASWDIEKPIGFGEEALLSIPKTMDIWLAEAEADSKWLFPLENDMPAISSTHIYIQHGVGEKVELLLNGESVSLLTFEGAKTNDNQSAAVSRWRGVEIKEGNNHFVAVITDRQGKTVKVVKQDVYYATPPVKAKMFHSDETLTADGKTVPKVYVQLFDQAGKVARAGIIGEYTVDYPYQTLEDYQKSLLPEYVREPSHFKTTDQGIAELALLPTLKSGEVTVRLRLSDGEEVVKTWMQPAMRDWILVGFAEGTVGFNELAGAVQPILNASEQDRLYTDGRVALYAKGQLSGDFLLTLAYDTNTRDDGNNRHFGDIDPNVMYTVYGDTTQQEFDASSQEKLYLKIEKETFYALFGDFNTDLTVTEFSRYSRTLTGVKTELHEDSLGFSAFAAQTSQTMVSDSIRGNGTSGLYRLSRSDILENTETVRIETMDRFRSEQVLETTTLIRHLDYDIDYLLGTIWFKQPVMSKDTLLNPIMIRVDYESDDLTDKFTVAGGRIYVKPHEDMEMGGTFISEGRLGTSNTLSGVDVKLELGAGVELRAEAASSVNDGIASSAWKVEGDFATEDVSGTAYLRQQDDSFGLGQQPASENATLKAGVGAEWRLDQESHISSEIFRQETTNTGAVRDMAFVQYNEQLGIHQLHGGLRANRDQDGAGTVTESALASLGGSSQISDRFSVRADHEEALSQNNGIDFPTRSSLGADYRLTTSTSLSATQEWTSGQFQDTTSSRVGINSQAWDGGLVSASYEQQLGEDGPRSFANAGLLQSWQITQALSVSAGIDQTTVLSKGTPVQLNLNAPIATGGEDFTAYSVGMNYRPGTWIWTNRLEQRVSDLSKHHGASLGVQGSVVKDLATQFTLLWQNDALATGTNSLISDASMRVAWRTDYDALILLNRFDIRRNEQTGGSVDNRSLRYINNMTANWQTEAAWQFLFNHGIKLSNESLGGVSSSGISDLLALHLIYDFNAVWDMTLQTAALRVRSLDQIQPNYGLAIGYNMFDNFWLNLGYNFEGFYDPDFAAAEYSRKGVFMRFRFKFDQDSLGDMLK